MRRHRKCCCCLPGDSLIVATSPTDSPEWNLTAYREKRYKKYAKKCWRIEQSSLIDNRTCTLAVGKVSKSGKLSDLPDTVALKRPMEPIGSAEYSAARLIVSCSKDCGKLGGCEKCGDPGVNGIVIRNNAGIDGDYWDLSDLIGMQVPKDANGNPFYLRGRTFQKAYWNPVGEDGLYFNYTLDADGKIDHLEGFNHSDDNVASVHTEGRYAELYYSCGGYECIPSEHLTENKSYVLDSGCLVDLSETYRNAAGVAPPGSVWILQSVVDASGYGGPRYDVLSDQCFMDVAAVGIVGAAGDLLGFPESDRNVPYPMSPVNMPFRPCVVEIMSVDYCNQQSTWKTRIEYKQIIGRKRGRATFKRAENFGSTGDRMYYISFDYDISDEYASALAVAVNCNVQFSVWVEAGSILYKPWIDVPCEGYSPSGFSDTVSTTELSGTGEIAYRCYRNPNTNQPCPPTIHDICNITEAEYGYIIKYFVVVQ